jgi:hypothetical protein
VYPALDVEDGSLLDIYNLEIPEKLKGLLEFMIVNDKMAPIKNYDEKNLHIMSDDVLSKIKFGAKNWEEDVPYEAVQAIKFFELFGYSK